MKLTQDSLKNSVFWKGYRLPQYDIAKVREHTAKHPTWLHFGAGSLFRAFPSVIAQRLLTAGLTKSGIICCESFDEELIDKCFRAIDHLSLVVTLYSNGSINKEVVASVTESLKMSEDAVRLLEIFTAPTLQMVSFTITEKGYVQRDDDYNFLPEVEHDLTHTPEEAQSFFGKLSALCLARAKMGLAPIALVSLDNCQNNGERLHCAVRNIADGWLKHGIIDEAQHTYLTQSIRYPTSMIDKITPHPDLRITKALEQDELENARPFVTAKGTQAAIFVNTERPQYLLMENDFPNGHPPFEQTPGVVLTSRQIVERSAQMKACTCMNPMDTALGLFGCLLGYTSISEEMKNPSLVALINKMSLEEAMPVVTDPGVIDPFEFLHEVLAQRYPNPYLPDTPQRTATDTSLKLPIRFGVTLYAYYNSPVPMHRASRLIYIPLVLAGWLRYLVGVDDAGQRMTLSPDPNFDDIRHLIGTLQLGETVSEERLYPLLASRLYFGHNLFEMGVGETVVKLFNELNAGPGAVRETLQKYCIKEAHLAEKYR